MIKAEHLDKRYGDKVALSDLSFHIGAGEIVGLLGLNGAGKSTTMNILTGYIGATRGKVSIGGFDMQKEPLRAKRLIGCLPEQPAFYGGMRVSEYLDFICDLKGLGGTRAFRRAHIGSLCEKVGLSDKAGRLIRNLSKGYRQRVSFAQALAGDPKVLILDEPTVGLDPSQVMEIRSLIRELGKTATVLISSHILSEIRELCQRVIVLKEGRLVADDSPEHLAEGTRRLDHVKFRAMGSRGALEAALAALPPPAELRYLGELEGGTSDFELFGPPGRDAREDLFRALAAAGLPLLYTYGGEASLEDIFLHLVGRDGGATT
ncbi:MAG: ABC transporter ATP-binding protein [Christensenellales bacterium]